MADDLFPALFQLTATDPKDGAVHVVLSDATIEACKLRLHRFLDGWVRRASVIEGNGTKQLAWFLSWHYEITGLVDGVRKAVEEGLIATLPDPFTRELLSTKAEAYPR